MLHILYVGIMVMVPGVSRNPGQMLYPPAGNSQCRGAGALLLASPISKPPETETHLGHLLLYLIVWI